MERSGRCTIIVSSRLWAFDGDHYTPRVCKYLAYHKVMLYDAENLPFGTRYAFICKTFNPLAQFVVRPCNSVIRSDA